MAKHALTIDLDKPLIGHAAPIKQLHFREPGWIEYTRIGEAYVWAPRAADNFYPAPIHDNVRAYAEACLVEPTDVELLAQVGLKDSKKIAEGFIRFFLAADPANAASKTSSESSSETPGGGPLTSET